MINYTDMVKVLTADYTNVYIFDPIADTGEVVKLEGMALEGIKQKPKGFCVSEQLRVYADARLHPEDKQAFLDVLLPQSLAKRFQMGNDRLEMRYRILEDGVLHHYGVLVSIVSQPGEPLVLLMAYRNMDGITSAAKREHDEGMNSAYAAISQAYLSMHRVNVPENTYYAIKTTQAIKQFEIAGSNKFDENIHRVIKALATDDSYNNALKFMDLSTLPQRMQSKSHVYTNFTGKVAGPCRLHFLKEDEDDAGNLLHVIFAVEVLDEEQYVSAFDALARNFLNVYSINLENGEARFLKLDGYTPRGLDKGNSQVFDYPTVLSRYIADRVHPEDQTMVHDAICLEHLREVFATQDEYIGNYRALVDGEAHNYQFNVVKVQSGQFVVAGFQNIDDIVEESLAEERKRQEQERGYQKQLRANLGVINALGCEYENLFLVNFEDNTYRVIRTTAGGMHDAALGVIAGNDYRAVMNAYIDNFVVEEERDYMRAHTTTEAFLRETPANGIRLLDYRRPNGNELYDYQLASALFTDEDGTRYLVMGYRNVTDMMRRERARAAELDDLHSIIRASEMGTWQIEMLEGKHPTMQADDLMLELLGVAGEDLSPEEVYDSWYGRIVPSQVQSVLDSVEKMKSGRDENTYLWDNPKLGPRYVRCGGTGVEVPGGWKFRGYHYDVDEDVREQIKQSELLKNALDAAQHANRAKTTFLNSMSHDIRTPMNAIMGYTALAASHANDMELVQDYLSKIATSSSHLLALINDVLDMSRIESGKVTIDEKETHLPDVMHDIRTIMQANVSAHQLDFFIDTQDVQHEGIICDKLRLQQVLLNMLSNAVKFTEPGGAVALRIVEKPYRGGDYAHYEFRVKDTGIGMSSEFQQHIFEPFTREKTSTVSGIQGTGLGMAITKNIVDMMGGNIAVSSKLGEGTEFVVSLDFKISGHEVKYEKIPELQGMRALVADDDSDTAVNVANMLKEIGMRSDWTLSGKEAVLRAKVAVEEADEYGAYILDWLMPDMNGIETVRQIRHYIGDNTPIFILTAYDWGDIEEEAKAAGVTAFVSKPIFMSELREVLSAPFVVQESEPEVADDPAELDVSGAKVLLVEDNAMNQEIAVAILSQRDIQVDVASDGFEAVETLSALKSCPYDLVFMDLQMPNMDGYEATRAIRALPNADVANVPIVAMTANAFDEDRVLAVKAGMDDYITKPIDINKTIQVIFKMREKGAE